jgi:hypothetical protein
MIALGLLIALHAKDKHKAELIKKIRAQIKLTSQYLGDYSARPPAFTSDKADSMYVLRGETDIHIVELALTQYANGQVGADVVGRAVEQMDRDIEDIPPVQGDSVVPHGRRI